MIIEIKDIPNGQLIEKLDLHIDFQKGLVSLNSDPLQDSNNNIPQSTIRLLNNQSKLSEHQEHSENNVDVPNEMLNTEF